jgi:uncharacterized membrane-anchored protein YitT (DUF2179 family)
MKTKVLKTVREYFIILLGSFVYALAFDWLFVPNNIVMGGFTGLAQTLNHYIPALPIGTAVMIMNIPLFIIGIKIQGIKLLISSVFAMITSSLAVDILPIFIDFSPIDDHLMVSILGGALVGVGLGFQLLVGATTGGTELAATLLKYKFKHIQIGRICLLIDLCVITVYALTFRSLNQALYAVIAMFISSTAMDTVIYGRKTSKVACIVCHNDSELMQDLIRMDLGITEIKAKGGFSQDDKKVLICAFKPNRIALLKKAVIQRDPNAFVIVCDAQEVYGEGFAQCMLNSI